MVVAGAVVLELVVVVDVVVDADVVADVDVVVDVDDVVDITDEVVVEGDGPARMQVQALITRAVEDEQPEA